MSERHPIAVAPSMTLDDRVRHIEAHLAMLWDQVWWMNLPEESRAAYRLQGFRDPIEHFYVES